MITNVNPMQIYKKIQTRTKYGSYMGVVVGALWGRCGGVTIPRWWMGAGGWVQGTFSGR